MGLLAIGAPFILHFIGRNQLINFEKSRSKAKVSFFWAVASLAHVFNIYILLIIVTITLFYNHIRPGVLNIGGTTAVGYIVIILTLIESCILAYIHSKYITFPIPATWSMLTNCCRRKATHNHHNNVSLGDIPKCSGSINMCSISILVS